MAVGIVAVSHSRELAEAAVALAMIMVHDDGPPVTTAAGMPDGGFGTDAARVMEAIAEVDQGDGVVILTDMGSAIMSAEMGVEFYGGGDVRILPAPFVEGLTAAVVRAAGGANIDEVATEANAALGPKLASVGELEASAGHEPADAASDGSAADVTIVNEAGLHARPAAQFVKLAATFDAVVMVSNGERGPVNANSPIGLATLGGRQGDTLHIEATGPQAREAVEALAAFVTSGLGD